MRLAWDLDATSGDVSFELESRGGYRRIVTGTIAYLDEEAHAYMVLAADGKLIRVPVRDITKTTESVV
jgi:hypothetical protein